MTEHTHFINEWMVAPRQLNDVEKQQMEQLLEQYPYFAPARMMEAAQSFSEQDFSKEMLNDSQLYRGNWLLFYKMMHASRENLKQQTETPALKEAIVDEEQIEIKTAKEEELIQPVFAANYFQHQGINVAETLPEKEAIVNKEEEEKALMVMMGFDEWLLFLKKKNEAKKSDEADKAQLRSIWQREKLAAAIGEEDDNIPEAVFEMAINSIDKQDIMVSEPLAEIHIKQGRYDKALEIYRKLSLQNPEKKTYFAAKINQLNKEN